VERTGEAGEKLWRTRKFDRSKSGTIADFERPNSSALTPDGTITYAMDRDNGLVFD
jgi:hypothetical protein